MANSNSKPEAPAPEIKKDVVPTIAKERGTEAVASRNVLNKPKTSDKVNGIARERR